VPLAEHFDGTRWSIVSTTPVPSTDDVRLAGVSFSGALDGWAVGADENLNTGTGTSIIEHFNGTSWTRLPSRVGGPARLASGKADHWPGLMAAAAGRPLAPRFSSAWLP
jgi:hypothetical protein